MRNVVLTSGCFINHEDEFIKYTKNEISGIELTSHSLHNLEIIVDHCQKNDIDILSIHTPVPKVAELFNIGCSEKLFKSFKEYFFNNVAYASNVNARYVLFHAFYTLLEDVPSNDIERAAVLNSLSAQLNNDIQQYIDSDVYQAGMENVIRNLKNLLPEMKKKYNNMTILLENLNPKISYGGILLKDLIYIVNHFDGEVGICLDMGHLHLTESVLNIDSTNDIIKIKDLIYTTHIHQNFSGEYCVDRNWDDSSPMPTLQDVDIHMPLSARYKIIGSIEKDEIHGNNNSFKDKLKGVVQFTRDEKGSMQGNVPWKKWLSILNDDVIKVIETDSRYAPLDFIMKDFDEIKNIV